MTEFVDIDPSVFENTEVAALESVYEGLLSLKEELVEKGASQSLMMSLESLSPGTRDERYPLATFTKVPTQVNYSVAMENVVKDIFKAIWTLISAALRGIGAILKGVGKILGWIGGIGGRRGEDVTATGESLTTGKTVEKAKNVHKGVQIAGKHFPIGLRNGEEVTEKDIRDFADAIEKEAGGSTLDNAFWEKNKDKLKKVAEEVNTAKKALLDNVSPLIMNNTLNGSTNQVLDHLKNDLTGSVDVVDGSEKITQTTYETMKGFVKKDLNDSDIKKIKDLDSDTKKELERVTKVEEELGKNVIKHVGSHPAIILSESGDTFKRLSDIPGSIENLKKPERIDVNILYAMDVSSKDLSALRKTIENNEKSIEKADKKVTELADKKDEYAGFKVSDGGDDHVQNINSNLRSIWQKLSDIFRIIGQITRIVGKMAEVIEKTTIAVIKYMLEVLKKVSGLVGVEAKKDEKDEDEKKK